MVVHTITAHRLGARQRPLDDNLQRFSARLDRLLRVFTAQFRSDLPVQHIRAFLLVAYNEGKGINALADLSGVANSVMSRHLHDIGDRQRNGEPGFGLVSWRMGRTFRDREMYLTDRGERLLAQMERDWQMSAKGE